MRPEKALQQGAARLGLALAEPQLRQLLDFLELLQKWGRVYNLTAVRDPLQMLTHHLLDSLATVAPLERELRKLPVSGTMRLLDVGSGAGLPGVVHAICCSQLAVSCVDAVAKKAAFIQQVSATLGLTNLRAIHARVENLQDEHEVVVARAFASLADFTRLSWRAIAPEGIWMAMKGLHPDAEIAALSAQVQVFHVEPLEVPDLEAQRCLVWMRRTPGT